MKVGMITCWYKNVSTANYSYNLCTALSKYVDIKIISAPCMCWRYFVGEKDVFQSECEITYFPPYVHALEAEGSPKLFRIFLNLAMMTLQLLRGISYLAKCKDVDLIHYQQTAAYSFGMVPLLIVLAIPTQKRRVVTIHRLGLLTKFLSCLYRNADGIIVHSSDMKSKLLSFGVPEYKIRLVPHGAAIPPLLYLPRKEITFFGQPSEDKGFFTILLALKFLKDRGRMLRLYVYSIYSEMEKERAIKMADELGVSDLISWGGLLSESEFDRKMQQSIFTLAPYTRYVSGSSIVTRAMGNATPIIASNVGGIPEHLGDGGLLIPKNDPEALAKAMIKLIEDETLREMLSEKGRRRAEAISWDNIAKITIGIYRECMEKMNFTKIL